MVLKKLELDENAFYVTSIGLQELQQNLQAGIGDKQKLVNNIKKAVIIETMEEYLNFDENEKMVILGSKVTVRYAGDEPETFVLGGSEVNHIKEKGLVSSKTDFAKKIFGKKIGDTVELNNTTVEILAIEKYEFK